MSSYSRCSLSDEELHQRLLELGITTPVTATTRPLLVKKLLQSKQNKKPVKQHQARQSPRRQSHRSLQALSSDEDEDLEDEEEEEEEDDEGEQESLSYANTKNRSSTRGNTSSNGLFMFRYDTNNTSSNRSYSKTGGGTPVLQVPRGTSTPSSVPSKASGTILNKHLQVPTSGGKLFPSVSPRSSSSRWKNSPSIPVDYDTASDSDDIVLNSTANAGSSRRNASSYRYNENGEMPSKTANNSINNTDLLGRRLLMPRSASTRQALGNSGTVVGNNSVLQDTFSDRNKDGASFNLSYRHSRLNNHVGDDVTDFRRSPYISRDEGSYVADGVGDGSSWLSSFFSPAKKKGVLQTSYLGTSNNSSRVFPALSMPALKNRLPSRPGVPSLLLVLLLAFFVVLCLTYLSKVGLVMPLPGGGESDVASAGSAVAWEQISGKEVEEDGVKLPVCGSFQSSTPASPCLTAAEVAAVRRLPASAGRGLVAEAVRRNGEYQCRAAERGYLTLEEVQQQLAEWGGLQNWERPFAASALVKLCSVNPSLGLEAVYSIEEVPPHTVLGLRVRAPQLHLLCAIMTFATGCLYVGALVGLACGVFYGVLACVRRLQHRRQARQQQVFSLVSEVVSQVRDAPLGYTAVHHVRDQLFSPQERLANRDVWRDVVDFVEEHESRVVREVRVVAGEETEVWRWIGQKEVLAYQSPSRTQPLAGGADQSRVDSPRKATPALYPKLPAGDDDDDDESDSSLQQWWQGPGVGRRRPGAASVQAPTRCLKIRNMRSSDRSVSSVRRALLLQCRGLSLLHVAVERDSEEGLVYAMADTCETAGKVHTLLHGCWCCGQLLSVKFLREERYRQRFPAAAACTVPLSP